MRPGDRTARAFREKAAAPTRARCCATAAHVRAHANGGVLRYEEDPSRRCHKAIGILPPDFTPMAVVMRFEEVDAMGGNVGFYCKTCNRVTEYAPTQRAREAA